MRKCCDYYQLFARYSMSMNRIQFQPGLQPRLFPLVGIRRPPVCHRPAHGPGTGLHLPLRPGHRRSPRRAKPCAHAQQRAARCGDGPAVAVAAHVGRPAATTAVTADWRVVFLATVSIAACAGTDWAGARFGSRSQAGPALTHRSAPAACSLAARRRHPGGASRRRECP